MSAPSIKPSHEGKFHRWLGKGEDEPITMADVAKGLKSKSAAARSMANFARMAKRGWKKLKD